MPDIDIDFDDRRRGEMVRYAADKWGSDRVAQVITFGTIKTKAALKDSARVHYGQPGFAIADRITKALPPPIMAKDIPLSGITDTEPRAVQGGRRGPRADRHRPRRAHHLRDRARPGGPGPQRRRARLRGDHELRAADRGDPAVEAAAGRRDHHRLGLSVVRGHRPAEDGLPGPAQPDDHRRRAREHQGQQGNRPRPGSAAARRPGHLRIARPRRHSRRVPARRRADARPAAPHAAHRLRGHRRGASRCTGPARWA